MLVNVSLYQVKSFPKEGPEATKLMVCRCLPYGADTFITEAQFSPGKLTDSAS